MADKIWQIIQVLQLHSSLPLNREIIEREKSMLSHYFLFDNSSHHLYSISSQKSQSVDDPGNLITVINKLCLEIKAFAIPGIHHQIKGVRRSLLERECSHGEFAPLFIQQTDTFLGFGKPAVFVFEQPALIAVCNQSLLFWQKHVQSFYLEYAQLSGCTK